MYPQELRVGGKRSEQEVRYGRPDWQVGTEVDRGKGLGGRGGGISSLWISLLDVLLG
jgi:hypothetical protein